MFDLKQYYTRRCYKKWNFSAWVNPNYLVLSKRSPLLGCHYNQRVSVPQSKNAVCANIKYTRYFPLHAKISGQSTSILKDCIMFHIVDTSFSYGRALIACFRIFPRQKKIGLLCVWSKKSHTAFLLCRANLL